MVIAGSSFSKQTDSKSHAFANNWSSRRYKNHAGIDSLTPFSRIRAIRKCAQQIFLFLSCRVGRGDRVILYQPFLMLTHLTPCRSFTSDKARANSSAICPDALGTYTYSTRGGNASFDPTLVGAIAVMAVVKKIGAGIGARNHGVNILKSRRRVWNLRRGRPRAIGLTVTAASRNDRLQALPQLTSPERLG